MDRSSPDDNEGVVYFNRGPGSESQILEQRSSHADPQDTDPQDIDSHSVCSESSYSYLQNRDAEVNTSFERQRQNTAEAGLPSDVLNGITGVLKDVVTELRNLKQAQTQSVPSTNESSRPSQTSSCMPSGQDNTPIPNQYGQQLQRESYREANTEFSAAAQAAQDRSWQYQHQNFQNRSAANLNRNSYDIQQLYDEYGQPYMARDLQNRRGTFFNPAIQSQMQRHRFENIKIPAFSGKDDWAVWISRFEAIAQRYRWSDEDKIDQLLPRIEGKAAEFMFSQLQPRVLYNYRELVQEMNNRFMVIQTNRAFAAKFSRRIQKAGETAEDFAADLKMLYDKAHGYRDRTIRNEDLVRRFLDGLRDDEARFEVEYHKEPSTIDEAVFHVVNFIQTRGSSGHDRRSNKYARRTIDDYEEEESVEGTERVYRMPERKQKSQSERRPTPEDATNKSDVESRDNRQEQTLQKILERLEKLEKANKADTSRRGSTHKNSAVECFNCHRKGHYARECPDKQRTDRKPGNHIHRRENYNDASIKSESLNYQGPALEARERSA